MAVPQEYVYTYSTRSVVRSWPSIDSVLLRVVCARVHRPFILRVDPRTYGVRPLKPGESTSGKPGEPTC